MPNSECRTALTSEFELQHLKFVRAALEALVGNPKRIVLVAADLVQNYERRLEAMGRAWRVSSRISAFSGTSRELPL